MSRFGDIETEVKQAHDFVRRGRNGNIRLLVVLYAAILVVMLWLMTGKSGQAPLLALLSLLGLVSALALYAMFTTKRNLDLMTELEFQNALFSSALTRHSDFSMIIHESGRVAYMDRGFAQVFQGFTISDHSLNGLLEVVGVAQSDAERLYDAVKNKRRDWFLFPFTDVHGQTTQMILNLSPLSRPGGYFLIQGRRIVERQGAARRVEQGTGISESSYRYMLFLFNEMPMGAYALSPSGHLQAANRVLEQWLGYEEQEVLQRNFVFEDLLYKADTDLFPDCEMKEYTGPVALSRKNGSLFSARLEQHLVRDAEGNILAVIGMVRMPQDKV